MSHLLEGGLQDSAGPGSGAEEDPGSQTGRGPASPEGSSPSRFTRRAGRYLGMPLVVAVACGLLFLYLEAQELDSIERRIITATNIRQAAIEQINISFWATLLTVVVAVPLGIALTRPWARRVTPVFVTAANMGQGIPAVGTIVLVFIVLIRGGTSAAIIGLAIYAILPVLRGTMVGLQQVDRSTVKAARGMGMSRTATLFRVELPLAVPVLLTGVRTAIVLTVSTSVLAAFIGGGTFGQFITSGFGQTRPTAIWVGAVGAASVAVLADWAAGLAEDWLRPRGL